MTSTPANQGSSGGGKTYGRSPELEQYIQHQTNRRTALMSARELVTSASWGNEVTMQELTTSTIESAAVLVNWLEGGHPLRTAIPVEQRNGGQASKDTSPAPNTSERKREDAPVASGEYTHTDFYKWLKYHKLTAEDLRNVIGDVPKYLDENGLTWKDMEQVAIDNLPITVEDASTEPASAE